MKAMRLKEPRPVEDAPLGLTDERYLSQGRGQVLIRVAACPVCHTDLHIIERELSPRKLPLTPGHQIVGMVERSVEGAERFAST